METHHGVKRRGGAFSKDLGGQPVKRLHIYGPPLSRFSSGNGPANGMRQAVQFSKDFKGNNVKVECVEPVKIRYPQVARATVQLKLPFPDFSYRFPIVRRVNLASYSYDLEQCVLSGRNPCQNSHVEVQPLIPPLSHAYELEHCEVSRGFRRQGNHVQVHAVKPPPNYSYELEQESVLQEHQDNDDDPMEIEEDNGKRSRVEPSAPPLPPSKPPSLAENTEGSSTEILVGGERNDSKPQEEKKENVIVISDSESEGDNDDAKPEQSTPSMGSASGPNKREPEANVFPQEIERLQSTIERLEGEKDEGYNLLQKKLVSLEKENFSKQTEAERLRLHIEDLHVRLLKSEEMHTATKREAQNIVNIVMKEQGRHKELAVRAATMQNQLVGAENEAYRLQSLLQDENKKRNELERQSENIRYFVREASRQCDDWGREVCTILDRFDSGINSIEKKRGKIMQMFKRKQLSVLRRQNCIICVSKPISVCYVPCGHRSVCPDCDSRIESCPVCRGHIRERVRTYDAGI
uniref:RING-type domain-containing protein n=1 Tax=Mucochytrium quahogii TaxID=96639 RepID=A0A7S2W6L7_9STRA|mmetsp:Transcript_16345/g.26630  ORF Transcript_16345/g.26630 Transcript_16345/m.26630 type:complete len:521 (-) Transcript_16345:609-2171(-)